MSILEPRPEEMPWDILPSAMELNSSIRVVSTEDSEAGGVSSLKTKQRLTREGGLLSVKETSSRQHGVRCYQRTLEENCECIRQALKEAY